MLHHMFYFGVILPTAIVIVFFILFLICWFQCGLRERFSHRQPARKCSTHNSTQSSLVTTSSGLPYPNGPPSKDYWEIEIEHDTRVDKKEPKYIPGDFSLKSENWIYMSHDQAQMVTVRAAETAVPQRDVTDAQVHVWTTSSETSSIDSHGSRHCFDGRASPEDLFINSNRSSPDSTAKHREDGGDVRPLRIVQDASNAHWSRIPNPDNLPHFYPSTVPGFEFTDDRSGQAAFCSPYAITNLIHNPAPAIRV